MRKKNEIVIKQRASTILTFSLNISTCDLDIFFLRMCACVCGCGCGCGGGRGYVLIDVIIMDLPASL